ncbi:hypothetical protein THAOC_29953 [Thalassiosira oceanica]|uniref:Uncharacterized protein n=1 Tax=Thalassiosira oceanica TaxID=159749 RepID=K0RB39_THAOC|nr:hypothetical protein THAOC_29953 [Thalassiosira oceanica]|eukprot:EJK50933.1 hypothetical protein THAOC_29953 [Thalassiosira oceanica]
MGNPLCEMLCNSNLNDGATKGRNEERSRPRAGDGGALPNQIKSNQINQIKSNQIKPYNPHAQPDYLPRYQFPDYLTPQLESSLDRQDIIGDNTHSLARDVSARQAQVVRGNTPPA